jgi:NTP pyrophosphatase (non-canonical NTP hydrolase)
MNSDDKPDHSHRPCLFDIVKIVNTGFGRKFPGGNQPYQIMTRLLEEGGELAQQVNHFENSGVKMKKYGEPDRAKLAQEAKGVLITLFQLVAYYQLETDLEASLDHTLQGLRNGGFLES